MKQIVTLFLIIFSNLLIGQTPSNLTKADKVYGLSKFWQEVNYNFVYLDKIDRSEWDNEYKKLIEDVQDTKNDYEYYRLLQKFCAQLKDGHTNVYFPSEIQNNIYNTYFGEYRLFLTNIEGKAIVTRINLSKKDEVPIGTEIVKVNGLETQDYINQFVKPYISSSTEYILNDWSISRLLSAPGGTKFDIDFKLPNGKLKSLTLTHSKTKEKEVYPEFEERELMDFKWMDKNIAYISLNSFGNPKIDSLFITKLPELYKAKSLIIDLRHNGGGSTGIGRKIFEYLTNDKFLYGSRSFTREHISTYKAWGKFLTPQDTVTGKKDWGLNKEEAIKYYAHANDKGVYNFEYSKDTINLKSKRIVVPTVILIGHQTASAAEDFLIFADNQEHMTKIGEPTFGSTGQPLKIKLPAGGSARICTKKDTYPNGKEFVGVGIKPDIEVSKTLQDYIENKDPVLEKATEYLKKIK